MKSDGETPVAFGVKQFSQTRGAEVLRIAVHADEVSAGEDYEWILYRGCDPHPSNPTWEDKAGVVPDDCVGYWPLGETGEDWSEEANDGTRYNNAEVAGQVGRCRLFAGKGWLDCGTDSSLRITGDLTVMAWVNRRSRIVNGQICAKGSSDDYTHM